MIIGQLNALNIPKKGFGIVLDRKRIDSLNKIRMFGARGSDDFTKCSIAVYGKPNKELVKKAKKLLSLKVEPSNKNLSAESVRDSLKEAIDRYGFKGWVIRERAMIAAAEAGETLNVLSIRKDLQCSKKFLNRLIIHEIGTHILRKENGRLQPFKIFLTGFPNYLAIEEGLAAVHEERAGVLSNRDFRNYAGRAIAVSMALKHSFREVYDYLKDYFSEDTAWKLTLRAKRGIGDTSKPGACTKDYVYLDGYYKVSEFLKTNRIEKLYYGKVDIEGLKYLKYVEGIQEPKYFPGYSLR